MLSVALIMQIQSTTKLYNFLHDLSLAYHKPASLLHLLLQSKAGQNDFQFPTNRKAHFLLWAFSPALIPLLKTSQKPFTEKPPSPFACCLVGLVLHA